MIGPFRRRPGLTAIACFCLSAFVYTLVVVGGQKPASAPDEADQPIKTSVQNPDAVAVVIGIADYQDTDIPRVTYAVNDAEAVRRVLTQTLGYADPVCSRE